MGSDIEATLAERGTRYGDFFDYANIAASLQLAMQCSPNWEILDAVKKQSLLMITSKIARILSGDPEYDDNWRDIQGYAKLVQDRLMPQDVA